MTVAACVLVNCVQAQVSQKELEDMAGLRTGTHSPFGGFADIEAQGQSLLQKYKDADSEDRIYCTMAEIYAGSGPIADRTIEYAQKALACPLAPEKRLHMYVFWGDSIQVMHAGVTGDDLIAARREAVMPYLNGLKEALAYNLPDEPLVIPRGGFLLRYRGIDEENVMKRHAQKEQARAKIAEAAEQQNKQILMREILIGQVAFMYSRKPFATDEIQALATQVIADDHLVGRLMAAVEKAIDARNQGKEAVPPAVEMLQKQSQQQRQYEEREKQQQQQQPPTAPQP